VPDLDLLADDFEAHRRHLRAVAYRMLGSFSDADDAVQEAWLRCSQADASRVDNVGGWLTTIVARICLNMLRTRRMRGERPLDWSVPDPVVDFDPEGRAVASDAVGLALLVVLDTLSPAERLAFVLHDLFDVPFEGIAEILERSPAAARQLASRARRRVRGSPAIADTDVVRQREVVTAFLAAAQRGDFEALLAVLDPDVVLRADYGPRPASTAVRGAQVVARGAPAFAGRAQHARSALINGSAGVVVVVRERLLAVLAFAIRDGRATEIDILVDPDRLARLSR
jgi:RNA polymerase sigma-70 factor, ECF subfamily